VPSTWSPVCSSYSISKKSTEGTERGRNHQRLENIFILGGIQSLETAEAFKIRNGMETRSKKRAAFISHNARTKDSPVNLLINKFRAKKKKCDA